LLGQMLLNFYSATLKRNPLAWARLKGNLVALGAAAKGRSSSFEGHWK